MKTNELKEQMELSLVSRAKNNRRRSKKPTGRANWWFHQMRSVVDRAVDWTPRPTPPAHQVYLSLERPTPNW